MMNRRRPYDQNTINSDDEIRGVRKCSDRRERDEEYYNRSHRDEANDFSRDVKRYDDRSDGGGEEKYRRSRRDEGKDGHSEDYFDRGHRDEEISVHGDEYYRSHRDEGYDGNREGSSDSERGDRRNARNRGDRPDGWNNSDKRDTWGSKANWSDRRNNDRWEERKEDWNKKKEEDWRDTRNKDTWSDRKEGWNKRKDDPWAERDRDRNRREGDDVDDGREDRERRGRDRERRDRERDRDRSRERSRSYRRSSSKSPDRDNQQSSQAGEWICKCGALNFKRRVSCFRNRCGASRSEAVSVVTTDSKTNNKQQNPMLATMISTQQYTADDIPTLATYSAQLYAENPTEHATYLKYYTEYYTQQLVQKVSDASKTEADKVNAAAAVAQSAISQVQAKATPVKTPPTGTDNKIYPVPDISTYLYDQTSGYYYDSVTGLYYDANTQYYFNNQINQYLFWDSAKFTYVLASTLQNYIKPAAAEMSAPPVAAAPPTTDLSQADDKKLKTGDKTDKVKVAKKIAKDMERWAKAMNQKKEAAKVGTEPQANSNASSSKSADIGFSVLEQRVPTSNNAQIISQPPSTLVPSYGGGSDSSGDEGETYIDWDKLACLLCKRQFPSKDVLEKHQLMSELHKQNLEVLRGKRGEGKSSNKNNREPSAYRDRAAERRMKYGEDDAPIVRATRPDPVVPSVPQEIGEENIGNRLLKKMGWTAGKGLGKEGQGILGPVEATTTGLGRKKGIYTAGPGETYRGCVKKLTMARYQDLIGSEGNS